MPRWYSDIGRTRAVSVWLTWRMRFAQAALIAVTGALHCMFWR